MNTKRKLIRRMNIGRLLFHLKFKPHFSTGIGGQTTCGYGRLSPMGYFKYPVYKYNSLNT